MRWFGLIAVGAIGFSSSLLAATPLLHYKLNEGTGTTVADTGSLPAANGTFAGAAAGSGWSTDTPSGTGYSYSVNDNSGSSYISGGTISKIEGLGNFTIALWLKISDIAVNDRIFSTRTTVNTNGFLDLVARTGSTADNLSLSFQSYSPGMGSVLEANSITFDASDWAFVAIVRSGSTLQYWIGDNLVGSSLNDGGSVAGLTTFATNANSGEFRLGGTASTANNRTPDGLFSDFRIYGEALDLNAINAIRQGALIPEPATTGAIIGLSAVVALAVLSRSRRRAARR